MTHVTSRLIVIVISSGTLRSVIEYGIHFCANKPTALTKALLTLDRPSTCLTNTLGDTLQRLLLEGRSENVAVLY